MDRVGHSHWTARHTAPARLPVIATQRQGHTCHGSALRPPTLKLVLGAQHEDQRAATLRDNEPGHCLPTSLREAGATPSNTPVPSPPAPHTDTEQAEAPAATAPLTARKCPSIIFCSTQGTACHSVTLRIPKTCQPGA